MLQNPANYVQITCKQEYLKRGCPHSLRGMVWAQVLGSAISEKDHCYYNELKEAVITVDSVIILIITIINSAA